MILIELYLLNGFVARVEVCSFIRRINRVDSMQLRVVIGTPSQEDTYHNFIFKTPKKIPSAGGPLLGIFSVFRGNMIRLRPISAHLRGQKDGT